MVVTILTVLFVLVCPLLIGVILIQEPKGGGLAGVLGGAGAASPFGAQTAKFVMYSTVTLGFLFFALTLVLGITLRSTETAVPSLGGNQPAESAPLTPASTPASTPAPAPASAPSGATSQPAAPAAAPATPAPSAPAQT